MAAAAAYFGSEKFELEQVIAELGKEHDKLRTKMLEEADEARKLNQAIEQATTQLRRYEQKLDSDMSRRDTMKEMQDAMDGFMHGVKEILKLRDVSNLPLLVYMVL